MGLPLTLPFTLGSTVVDKVRPLKLESAATGGTQEDVFPTAVNPTEDFVTAKGFVIRDTDTIRIETDGAGSMIFNDVDAGTYSLSDLSSGTSENHRSLDQLVHNIAETSYTEPTYNGNNQPIAITVWTDSGKTIKRYEELITYTSGVATQVIARRYDGTTNNVVVGETITLTPSYTGGIVNNINNVVT